MWIATADGLTMVNTHLITGFTILNRFGEYDLVAWFPDEESVVTLYTHKTQKVVSRLMMAIGAAMEEFDNTVFEISEWKGAPTT